MALTVRREPDIVPQYSLTGDLLSFMRCGLQYRYHNGSSLPPSRPVQLWFGEFIHGVLEAAYRIWFDSQPAFPWPCTPTPYHGQPPQGRLPHDLGEVGDIVEETLRVQGKSARSTAARDSAYRRAEATINELGPDLFPLISAAEEKVIGTRQVPQSAGLRADRYELHGIIDVLTDVTLTGASDQNPIRHAIQDACPGAVGRYEVILDYKGSHRPTPGSAYWQQGEWQVQTYAWLRMRQANALPVVAGVLLYINELAPGSSDIARLQREIRQGVADVVPANGSPDYYALNAWQSGVAIPQFSLAFRLERAMRVIPITPASQQTATQAFDGVVRNIEQCVRAEEQASNIDGQWNSCGDDETCAACDFRHFCPNPSPRTGTGRQPLRSPPAP